MFSLPMGLCINALHTGRILRGTFTYTLFIALMMRTFDNGSGIEWIYEHRKTCEWNYLTSFHININ